MNAETVQARATSASGPRSAPASRSSRPRSTSSVEDMAVLAEAGVEVVGENRAAGPAGEARAFGDAFRWHFIGHLQSRKAKDVNASASSCTRSTPTRPRERLTVPALLQVNLAGEAIEVGRRARGARRRSSSASPVEIRGLTTMPPLADDPEASRPYFRRLRELAPRARARRSCRWARPRTTASPHEEGATFVRVGLRVVARLTFRRHGLRRPLEPHARLLRHRRGVRRGVGRRRLRDRGGARAELRRAAERERHAA